MNEWVNWEIHIQLQQVHSDMCSLHLSKINWSWFEKKRKCQQWWQKQCNSGILCFFRNQIPHHFSIQLGQLTNKREVNSSGNQPQSGIFPSEDWELVENTVQFRKKKKIGKGLSQEWMDSCWLVPMEAVSGRLWSWHLTVLLPNVQTDSQNKSHQEQTMRAGEEESNAVCLCVALLLRKNSYARGQWRPTQTTWAWKGWYHACVGTWPREWWAYSSSFHIYAHTTHNTHTHIHTGNPSTLKISFKIIE